MVCNTCHHLPLLRRQNQELSPGGGKKRSGQLQLTALAAYILKSRKWWKKAGGKNKQYTRSRNLHVPETKKTVIKTAEGYYEKPRTKKGWHLKKETEVHFTTEAGWPYMRYILIQDKDNKRRGSP